MGCETREDLLKKWKADLERIKTEVLDLHRNRKICRKVDEVVSANPRIKANPLLRWMAEGYAASACLAVRRLLDADPRSVSLATLIDDIRKNPGAITREHFVAAYPDWMQRHGHADRAFDQFAGEGGAIVDPEILKRKLAETRERCQQIRDYVNKFVAHTHRTKTDRVPTFKKLHEAVDFVGALFNELHVLIDGSVFACLEPEPQYNWRWIFEEPWVAPRR